VRTVLYSSVGETLTHYDVDVVSATLTRRAALQMPSVVQYGWPHPSGRHLYVSTTDAARGSATVSGAVHRLVALKIDADGALAFDGAPQPLRQRPIHNSVDLSGRFALTCYNAPSHLTVHRIDPEGGLGEPIEQPTDLGLGAFAHQVLALPSNRAVSVVVRGNNPAANSPGDPGALKLFRFEDGRLSPLATVAVGGRGGFGYGPRHLDFHPTQPWVYVLVELQNELHMHRMYGDLFEAEPAFAIPSTQAPPLPHVRQVAGAIHVHPNGAVLYASNRVSATSHPEGPFPFVEGENNIGVFSIDQITGEPRPIQFVDPAGFHVRAFTIDPSGRLLIAATLADMELRDGDRTRIVPAGLSLFRIADDGRLNFARRYAVEIPAPGVQHMWARAMALPSPG